MERLLANITTGVPSTTNATSPLAFSSPSVNVSSTSSSGTLPYTTLDFFYLSVGVWGVAFNLLALVVFTGYEQLRKRLPNYFFINQCVLDLVVGASQIVMTLVSTVHASGTGLQLMCYLVNSKIAYTGPVAAATWNVAALSLERYLEIVHPIRHKIWLTRRLVLAALVSPWIVGIAFKIVAVTPVVAVINGKCITGVYHSHASRSVAVLCHVGVELLIPISVVAFCYVEMFRATHKVHFSANGPQMTKARRNIIRILTLLVVCMVLTLGPKQVCLIVYIIDAALIDFSGMLYTGCMFLGYLMFCLNPFLYLWQYEDFRKGMRVVICRAKPAAVGTAIPIEAINHRAK